MSVKLEVGAWYDVYNGSAGGKLCQLIEILKDGEGMFYSPNDNGPRQYSILTSSGPHHIEPGDRDPEQDEMLNLEPLRKAISELLP